MCTRWTKVILAPLRMTQPSWFVYNLNVARISVVINTLNEEKNLPRALNSVKKLADEIIVVDMESTDKTCEIAKKFGAKVFLHKPTGYVEPARNFAISKATGDWILVLDADEEVPLALSRELREIPLRRDLADFYRLPRKNIVFDKWLQHSRWWPDYNVRFFKKGAVVWLDTIHSVPHTEGEGADVPPEEELAIIHYNYNSVSDYLTRMLRYTEVQAKDLAKKGYKFSWIDLIQKPMGEFLSRFFAGEGYKDGVHGLVLALLQAFSEMIVVVRVWEAQGFKNVGLGKTELDQTFAKAEYELDYWMQQSRVRRYSLPQKFLRKLTLRDRRVSGSR